MGIIFGGFVADVARSYPEGKEGGAFLFGYVPGISFRTDNGPFKAAMQRFTTKIVNMMKAEGLYESQGGPIILSQIENEYGPMEYEFGAPAKAYTKWAAQMAVDLGIGVPWVMCKQDDAPGPIINTCNGFYCDYFSLNKAYKPKIWTEAWTRWFTEFGGPVPYRPAEDLAFSVARFIQTGGSFINYYMVGAQSAQMKMTPVVYDNGFPWKSYNEEPASYYEDNSFTVGLLEQLNTTWDASDYLWYMTDVKIDSNEGFLDDENYPVLTILSAGQALHVFVDGLLSGTAYGSLEDPRLTLSNGVNLRTGVNRIALLSIAVGLLNIGPHFETWNAGVLGPVSLNGLNEGKRNLYGKSGLTRLPTSMTERMPRRSLLQFAVFNPMFLYVYPVLGVPMEQMKEPEVIRTQKLSSRVRIQDIIDGEGPEAQEGNLVEVNYVSQRSNGYFVHATVDQFSGESSPVVLLLDEKQVSATSFFFPKSC
ncbi:hypothetical protein Vadar_018013 [Vaccinium darrowii]|uniref:Uncharacterized protein n=1 Tax=Vaccinium darrowii TaxID=229202 RepID=A0ACB7YMU2_9ERIC|nr:hypothetical protein Vadar_018013 [Vaccinium darrowii]